MKRRRRTSTKISAIICKVTTEGYDSKEGVRGKIATTRNRTTILKKQEQQKENQEQMIWQKKTDPKQQLKQAQQQILQLKEPQQE